MNNIDVVIVSRSEDLPRMQCRYFFHSPELFRITEKTQGQKPYMVIAYDGSLVIAHMLILLRRRGSLFPPYLFTQGRAYGEGEYLSGYDKETIFGLMLRKIVKKLSVGICLYIEFRCRRHRESYGIENRSGNDCFYSFSVIVYAVETYFRRLWNTI